MIQLKRIAHLALCVRDLDLSKDFYMRVLGFELLEEEPDHGGVFLSLAGLGNTLDLFASSDVAAGPPRPNDARSLAVLGTHHMAFEAGSEAELRQAYFELKQAGVEILDSMDHESQKSIYFHDPDRNLLEIVWERSDAREIFRRGRADKDNRYVVEE
jgi:catechol 2,3-dioxygenase-like lactoylglutathione lyase family enzyme